jgi:Domain of unknown function (DUF222)
MRSPSGSTTRRPVSKLSGYLTPEARAGWDAVQAKLAVPGMCNPADETPTVSGTPSQEAVQCDARSTAQRNHDAFKEASWTSWSP